MTLTDQQLRQELINFGEIVPPVTQRNREQLRARLEVLRSQTRTRSGASPARNSHAPPASPSRTRAAAASPSRSPAPASPSRSKVTASPSRTRATAATASPSRSLLSGSPSATRTRATAAATASPSSTRANSTTSTTTSRPTTRSKQTPNLVELSDSETEPSSSVVAPTTPTIQTRSTLLRRQQDSPSLLPGGLEDPRAITNDVEQSIARHRREIKQLLDSARDRNRVVNTSLSSSNSGPQSTPIQSTSPSSNLRSRTQQHTSQTDTYDKNSKSSPKSDTEAKKTTPIPSPSRIGKSSQSFWKKDTISMMDFIKFLIVSLFFFGAIVYLLQKSGDLFPHQRAINCSIINATTCEDMILVIAAVRKQLQIRTGEVDCGFRSKLDILVQRFEIEKYLNEKGFKFSLGDDERWNTLVKHIIEKPVDDILTWNAANAQTKNINEISRLSTKQAIRSLTCRARQDISTTIRNVILLVLGSSGLIVLAWYLQRQSKKQEENEIFKSFLEKALKLLEEQYEKHIQDPQSHPWLSISDIRNKLMSDDADENFKNIWERVKIQISQYDSRIHSKNQEIDGEKFDVWQWIKSTTSSPEKSVSPSTTDLNDENEGLQSSEIGLTECLKLRNCFRSDNSIDDEEIDNIISSIQQRCATVKQIEHIGINSFFVYLKFSSKQAAAQGYHLLHNWKFQDRTIHVKYIRSIRYHEHFPEAKETNKK